MKLTSIFFHQNRRGIINHSKTHSIYLLKKNILNCFLKLLYLTFTYYFTVDVGKNKNNNKTMKLS